MEKKRPYQQAPGLSRLNPVLPVMDGLEERGRGEPLIDMVTAKVLGLEVPPMLLAQADECIE
ncbi:MAG: hypothetical protein ACJ8F3_12150 [Xanthobacteraceae bacterium]